MHPLCESIKKLGLVHSLADEFISANASRMLPDERDRLLDTCAIALCQYEDDLFSYRVLKNIAMERLDFYERQSANERWMIDIDLSDSCGVMLKDTIYHMTFRVPIEAILLAASAYRVH